MEQENNLQIKKAKRFTAIGINIFIIIWGCVMTLIGGAMGGNIALYISVLIFVPSVFIFLIKKGGLPGWYTSILTVLYAGAIFHFSLKQEFDLGTGVMVMYLVLLYSLVMVLREKESFVNGK